MAKVVRTDTIQDCSYLPASARIDGDFKVVHCQDEMRPGGSMFRGPIRAFAAVAAMALAASAVALAETPSGPPITIGFSMPLTGGLAVNGTSGLLAMQIWAEDTNAKGGLLGRPVKLVYYDDQTNPSL